MANTSQPEVRFDASRITVSRPGDSCSEAFARAATSHTARFSALDLSVSGFIAGALCVGVLLGTPLAVQAEEKPVPSTTQRPAAQNSTTKQVATVRPTPVAAKPNAAQVRLAKTTGVASAISRGRVSPIGTLRPVAVSSRRTANEIEATPVAEGIDEETRTTIKVEALPKIEVAHTATVRLVAAAPTETTTQNNTPQTASEENTAQSSTNATPAPVATETPTVTPVANDVTAATAAPVSAAATVSTDVPVSTDVAPTASSGVTGPSEPLTGTVDFDAATKAPANTPAIEAAPTGDQSPVAPGQPSRLYAPSISYEGGTIIAEGTPETPVRLESEGARIIAQKVRLDTVNKVVSAEGKVTVERQVTVQRYSAFRAGGQDDPTNTETVTETLQGENFEYNYGTRQGQLGATSVRLANFNISAESLTINGQKYTARNVIVRPGGLSDEELKIYGTPPFNLRLKEFTVDASKPARDNDVADTEKAEGASVNLGARTYGKGGSLYFKNTRLLPVPSALLSRKLGRREEAAFQITPRVYYNSSDGLLVTTKLFFPFSQEDPDKLTLSADVGLSTKVGFRGGAELETDSGWGNLTVGARINDVVVSQLTSRIELDRLPEIQYRPPTLRLFQLPGGRSAGLKFGFVAGDYRERFSDGSRVTESKRYQGQVRFTTRLSRDDGPYLDLFARAAKYSDHSENLRTAGYEIGYIGPITSRIGGQFSYSATNISGSTPFRFDEVEIRKELRATFDIMLTPRYIIPIDLRYDVERGELRDKRFGLLRNYKTFAYGISYQSARKEVKLEIRQGF